MKKLTFGYENLPGFTFSIVVEDDADIEAMAAANQAKIIFVETVEE